MNRLAILMTALTLGATGVWGQQPVMQRNYEIHRRGMLHETIFNTGEIGRAYDQGNSGSVAGVPSFEWPGNSAQIIDGKSYNGQYNSLGGGVYLGVNSPDSASRWYALCGGVGSSTSEVVWGRYSFPLGLERRENYPLLPDGSINPGYDRNEAEEIITSRWATNTGITVTRTSRAWSNPDYDDFIIYEYEMENTGDRNGDGAVESNATLNEVFVCFMYSLTPSMFGYERKMNRWRGSDFESQNAGLGNERARFDRRRWLNYTIDANGKPDPQYYDVWARTGEHGGGLNSPQAVGFVMLHIDTTYLANPDETNITAPLSTTQAAAIWGPNNHPKQPLVNRLHSSSVPSTKPTTSSDGIMDVQYVYRANKPITDTINYPPEWYGRGSFNWRQSRKFAVSRFMVLGPYVLPHGAKIRFALAEVAGYGAAHRWQTDAGMKDEGGSCGEDCGEASFVGTPYAFNPVPNWDTTITYGGPTGTAFTYGSTHLSTYKLPDYVNSSVVTVREVADRAIQTYLGGPLVNYDSTQFWPEYTSSHGVYVVPNSVISPIFTIKADSLPRNLLEWGTQVEPLIGATFSHYEVSRAPSALGPWTRLDSVGAEDPRYYANGAYHFPDLQPKIGEFFYYSVVSVDTNGFRSPRNNTVLHETQQLSRNNGAQTRDIYVVPNPFLIRSGYIGGNAPENRLCFVNLPRVCTIRIYSYSGQLVNTIEHNADVDAQSWYQVTRNNQQIASGIYFFVVDTPGGTRSHGKFVVIR